MKSLVKWLLVPALVLVVLSVFAADRAEAARVWVYSPVYPAFAPYPYPYAYPAYYPGYMVVRPRVIVYRPAPLVAYPAYVPAPVVAPCRAAYYPWW